MLVSPFKSAWGVEPADFEAWFTDVKAKGYRGVEFNPAFIPEKDLDVVRSLLRRLELEIIVQLFSSWPNYAGARPEGLTPANHLDRYREQLQLAKTFGPVLVNIQSGSDIWTVDQSVEFFQGTLAVDRELDLVDKVCHETHRNRSCYYPKITVEIVRRVPGLRLTGDISHWVVVCERLLDQNELDLEMLSEVIPHIHHLHCRIGTTQSSQCDEPDHPLYAPERSFFTNFWTQVIEYHRAIKSKEWFSFVPEYGPFPYHSPFAPRTNSQVADDEARRLSALLAAP